MHSKQPIALTCLHCGAPELAQLHEVWSYREFQVETCCEGLHQAVADFMVESPKAAGAWLSGLSDGVLGAMHRTGVRRIVESDGQLVIDWNLHTAPVVWADAKAFVKLHHRHCPAPVGWRFGIGLRNGPAPENLIGVVTVGRPVARGYDGATVPEVNRMCIRDDAAASGLAWNACSMGYGWASREAKRRGFKKIVTYTLESEDGTSLKAAGWIAEARTKGGSRSCASRPRTDKTSTEPKVRWSPGWCSDAGAATALSMSNDRL